MNSFNEFGHDHNYLSTPSETALNELRRSHGVGTRRWLHSLVDQAIDMPVSPEPEAQRINEDALQMMIKWMGRLFDEFELYTFEFNRQAAGTDLLITTSLPNLENTTVENDNFEAHLSTRFWTMAFAANSDAVDVYLMPVELLLAFTTNRMDERKFPFMTIQTSPQCSQYCWMIGDKKVSWEILPALAQELFGDLVNVASGNMDESELYDLPEEEPVSPVVVNAEAEPAMIVPGPEPWAPDQGPALHSFESARDQGPALHTLDSVPDQAPDLHTFHSAPVPPNDFLFACQNFAGVIDAQLQALSSQQMASGSDSNGAVECKELTTDLNALQMQLLTTMDKLKSAADWRAA